MRELLGVLAPHLGLQSDQEELKFFNYGVIYNAVIASIGPGGIEILLC